MSDTYWGFSATAWTAFYTVLTAGLLLVAIAAALYARDQVRVAQAARREATRPYVIVTAESSPIGWRVMDLVVRNIGHRPAYNVTVTLTPEPQRTSETPGAPITDVRWLKEVIPMLAPGQELRTYYDSMEERLNSKREDLPMSHDYTVEYDEGAEPLKKGKKDHRDTGVVDLNAMGGAMQPDVYNIHHVATALRDIKKEFVSSNKTRTRTQSAGVSDGRSFAEIVGKFMEHYPPRGSQSPTGDQQVTLEAGQSQPSLSGLQRLRARLLSRGSSSSD